MTDFATELLWDEAKQPVPPAVEHLNERQKQKRAGPRALAEIESLPARLQRVAGNTALAREAEEAVAAGKRLAAAAQRPERVPAAVTPRPSAKDDARIGTAEVDPKAAPAARRRAAAEQVARAAVAAETRRLPATTKAAAARAAALAQVLASFAADPARAELLALARLVERAPAGIAEDSAAAIARAVMRADPAQRAAIAARIKAELGDRRDLRLARLLADRLVGLAPAPARPAPPPPPPPAPPP
jgi:hypothetical protein